MLLKLWGEGVWWNNQLLVRRRENKQLWQWCIKSDGGGEKTTMLLFPACNFCSCVQHASRTYWTVASKTTIIYYLTVQLLSVLTLEEAPKKVKQAWWRIVFEHNSQALFYSFNNKWTYSKAFLSFSFNLFFSLHSNRILFTGQWIHSSLLTHMTEDII